MRTIEQVAGRTGQPARRLREWCATGQLACERQDRSWVMDEKEIGRVPALAAADHRFHWGGTAVALALPATQAAQEVTARVAERLRVKEADIAIVRLALDDDERALVVWPLHCREIAGQALEQLAEELGGDLLDARGNL